MRSCIVMTAIHSNETSTKVNLLTQPEYRHWSKELIKERIENDHRIRRIMVHDDKYHFCKTTIAIYNFREKPLLGEYKTVIMDTKLGIVISKKSTRAILHRYSKNILLSGLSLQKTVAHALNLHAFHSISLVHLVFFSLQAYTKNDTDWVGLHFFRDFCLEDDTIIFESIPINGVLLHFSFNHTSPTIHMRVKDSLLHNALLSKLAHNYHKSVAWECSGRTHQTGSMIFNSDFLSEKTTLLNLTLKHLVDQIIHDWHYIYMQHISNEYDMDYLIQDHPYHYRAVQRKRQNY